MIALESKAHKQNLAFTIVDKNCNSVDIKSFISKRNKSYLYSRSGLANCFESYEEAEKVAKKSIRQFEIKEVVFDNVDVSKMYNNEGANITGFDFLNERILIENKDKTKQGYDYRHLTFKN